MKKSISKSVTIAAALLSGVAYGGELKASGKKGENTQYQVSNLPSNGGTVSRGNIALENTDPNNRILVPPPSDPYKPRVVSR